LHGAVFNPDELAALSTALQEACRALKIDGDAKAREVVALRIVELARQGERNAVKLCARVVGEAQAGRHASIEK
jgi:hypothetical protein